MMIFLISINAIALIAVIVYYIVFGRRNGGAGVWDPFSVYGAVALLSAFFSCFLYLLSFKDVFGEIDADRVFLFKSPGMISNTVCYVMPWSVPCVAYGFLAILFGFIGYQCFKGTKLRVLSKLEFWFGILAIEMIFVVPVIAYYIYL